MYENSIFLRYSCVRLPCNKRSQNWVILSPSCFQTFTKFCGKNWLFVWFHLNIVTSYIGARASDQKIYWCLCCCPEFMFKPSNIKNKPGHSHRLKNTLFICATWSIQGKKHYLKAATLDLEEYTIQEKYCDERFQQGYNRDMSINIIDWEKSCQPLACHFIEVTPPWLENFRHPFLNSLGCIVFQVCHRQSWSFG